MQIENGQETSCQRAVTNGSGSSEGHWSGACVAKAWFVTSLKQCIKLSRNLRGPYGPVATKYDLCDCLSKLARIHGFPKVAKKKNPAPVALWSLGYRRYKE